MRNTRVKWPCLAVIWEARRDHEALVIQLNFLRFLSCTLASNTEHARNSQSRPWGHGPMPKLPIMLLVERRQPAYLPYAATYL